MSATEESEVQPPKPFDPKFKGCVYCGAEVSIAGMTAHWAGDANGEHPDFVVWQARAEMRAESGGPLSPTRAYKEGPSRMNLIDRGL